jgi:hypothetical protein
MNVDGIFIFLGQLKVSYNTWTSGTNYGPTGEYYWDSTGEFLGPYLNWVSNEPSNENMYVLCILLKNVTGSYKWADDIYGGHLAYICEKNVH